MGVAGGLFLAHVILSWVTGILLVILYWDSDR
jgi:hypothetical protein